MWLYICLAVYLFGCMFVCPFSSSNSCIHVTFFPYLLPLLSLIYCLVEKKKSFYFILLIEFLKPAGVFLLNKSSEEYCQGSLNLIRTLFFVMSVKHSTVALTTRNKKGNSYHVNVCNVNMTVCTCQYLYLKVLICSTLNLIELLELYSPHGILLSPLKWHLEMKILEDL